MQMYPYYYLFFNVHFFITATPASKFLCLLAVVAFGSCGQLEETFRIDNVEHSQEAVT